MANKAAIVILAGTESHENVARASNALGAAKEFKDAGDEVEVIFDGAGVGWAAQLGNREHKLNGLLESVRDKVAGACLYCARAFGAKEGIEKAGIPLLDEHRGHPSLRRLVADGYEVLTF